MKKNNKTYQQKNIRGFSLLELAIGLFVLSIIMLASASFGNNLVAAQRFEKTVAELQRIGRVVTGDPNMMQTGHQAEFGYFEMHRSWPSNISNLYEFIFEPMSVRQIANTALWHELLQDEWGTYYQVASVAGFNFEIRSAGEGQTFGTVAAPGDDIVYNISRTMYEGNIVRILVTDAKGTALRGTHAIGADGFHHLNRVQLRGYGSPSVSSEKIGANVGTSTASIGDMTYGDGYFEVPSVRAGNYLITVNPSLGGGGNAGNFALTDDLCGSNAGNANQETAIKKMITVYPRGAAIRQYFVVRLPGFLKDDEVGSY